MTTPERNIAKHYTTGDLATQILAALRAAGKDVTALTADDLAAVDAFHIRGRMATEELASWIDLQAAHRVLDIGCGLGGTARYLATTRGCAVTGVDITPEYCKVAELLSARVGLTDKTAFREASALDLPFAGEDFNVVWTEHVQMNIADKHAFYGEIKKVLKKGGKLAFHDIFAGPEGDLHFPVPWAPDHSINYLIPVDDLQALLADLGFETLRWEEKTEASIVFFKARMQQLQEDGPAHLGLHLLMGDNAAIKFENMLRNLEEGRVRVVQAVLQRQ